MPRPQWAGRVATVTSVGEWRSAPWVPRAEFGDPRADCRREASALEVCQFVTTRPALVALSAWPRAHGVTQVPIEAIEHPG
jgi:hypothetical protein